MALFAAVLSNAFKKFGKTPNVGTYTKNESTHIHNESWEAKCIFWRVNEAVIMVV